MTSIKIKVLKKAKELLESKFSMNTLEAQRASLNARNTQLARKVQPEFYHCWEHPSSHTRKNVWVCVGLSVDVTPEAPMQRRSSVTYLNLYGRDNQRLTS